MFFDVGFLLRDSLLTRNILEVIVCAYGLLAYVAVSCYGVAVPAFFSCDGAWDAICLTGYPGLHNRGFVLLSVSP